jgi:hypothetical protein
VSEHEDTATGVEGDTPPSWTADDWIRQQWDAETGEPESGAAPAASHDAEGAHAFQAAEPPSTSSQDDVARSSPQEPDEQPPAQPDRIADFVERTAQHREREEREADASRAAAFQNPAGEPVDDPLRQLYSAKRARQRRLRGRVPRRRPRSR